MYDRISFFGMPIKTLRSLGKIRVGRVTGNTHIFFWPKKIYMHAHVHRLFYRPISNVHFISHENVCSVMVNPVFILISRSAFD